MERFAPGTQIAIRTHRFGQIRTAKAVIVAEDSDEAISYWWPAGAGWVVTRAMTTPRDRMFAATLDELRRGSWDTTTVPWEETDVLATTVPGSWLVVWHMWHHDSGEFACWYVDLKRPHVRTPVGFDTYDLDLDIVVLPDRSWKWKDEKEFALRRDAGFITAEEADAIAHAAKSTISLIESGAPPFDGSLLDWRPHSGWPVPTHPERWRDVPLV